jgi:hypothetical protein
MRRVPGVRAPANDSGRVGHRDFAVGHPGGVPQAGVGPADDDPAGMPAPGLPTPAGAGLAGSPARRVSVSPRMAPEPVRQPPVAAATIKTTHASLLNIFHLLEPILRTIFPIAPRRGRNPSCPRPQGPWARDCGGRRPSHPCDGPTRQGSGRAWRRLPRRASRRKCKRSRDRNGADERVAPGFTPSPSWLVETSEATGNEPG